MTKKLIVNEQSVGSIETDENNIIISVFIHKTIDESIANQIDIVGDTVDPSSKYHTITIK
mgnify:CR=1 FL=1